MVPRSWTRTRVLVGALIAVAVVQIALGSLRDGSQHVVRPPSVRADGTLSVDPVPLTLADLDRYGQDTAARTVFEILFRNQWGMYAGLTDFYPPEIVDVVGREAILGSLRFERPGMLAVAPEISRVQVTGSAVSIELVERRRNAAPQRDRFDLLRIGGRWRVQYDSWMDNGLAAYTQIQAAGGPARAASADDVRAGLAAARRYRAMALNPGSVEQPPAQP